MSRPLKPYDVEVGGNRTTLLLSDADAKARGLTEAAQEPENAPEKARTASNKKRPAANKG